MIIRDKHLLSLRDLDLSDHLHDLAFAGISSFKIEGRLKDDLYLRNITVHYRRKLDAFLSGNPGFTKSSSGKVYPDFQPDPAKTFSRGRSNYFLMGRQHDITSFDTPKSAGEKIAMVIWSEGNTSRVNVEKPPGNNDGITWIDREGVLQGAKVNTVEGNMIRWAGPVDLRQGTVLYRNYDHAFSTMLRNSRTLRRIPLEITVFTSPEGLLLIGTDEAGISFSMNFPAEKVVAHDAGKAGITLREQLFKSGDSIFEVTEVKIQWDEPVFLPVSSVNAIRRDFLAAFTVYRAGCMPRMAAGKRDREAIYPAASLTWLGNVSNRLARQFYEKHGVSKVEPALEITRDFRGRRLMTMKHCLKYHLGYCPREKPASPVPWQEPLFLRDGHKKYRLEFDCKGCFMNLIHE